VPVVSLPNGCVERFVVDVKQPAAVRGAGHDRTRVSALDQAPQEVGRLLPVREAGELAVLSLMRSSA
jgi:hypothetical protein